MTWQEYFDMRVEQGVDSDLIKMVIGLMMNIFESYDWNAIVPFDVEQWGGNIHGRIDDSIHNCN